MLKIKEIDVNNQFVGRMFEKEKLYNISQSHQACIVTIYGRRRVGKTELLEQSFRNRNILKFEGVEGLNEQQQMQLVLQQLAIYVGEPMIRQITVENWIDVFLLIHRYIEKGTWTLYFEELQWLANYQDQFVSQLKYVWDNYFRHNPNLIILLCGSSPSFMINHVLHSKALYNRSQYEILLGPLALREAKAMLPGHSHREVMDAYLMVGGIPEYLRRLTIQSSILLSLAEQSFIKDGFFTTEYERIFISSMSNNPHYKTIVAYLSRRRFAKRDEIAKHIKQVSGGRLTDLLTDLELCGFIARYTPYNLADNSKLCRYAIADPYLQFYYKFIEPNRVDIQAGKYQTDPLRALNRQILQTWLGFGFERFCRNHHPLIAKILGFSAVRYQSGVFFNRETNQNESGYQIDLLFDRDDHVITICEIKYLQTVATKKVIDDFEKKLAYFPNQKNKTLQKVLITSVGIDDSLRREAYFDSVIMLDDLFQ